MTTKMTHAMRMELANAVRDRYATAAHKDKRRILEEFVDAAGYHEKSAIRVLNSKRRLFDVIDVLICWAKACRPAEEWRWWTSTRTRSTRRCWPCFS